MRRLLLQLLAAAPTAHDHIPDAELLRRFVELNDTAAFELIVRRHADAVWATAFHILKNEANAEDAFQASFLALIRKAKQICATCVGGWLHRVAVHAALKLRERTTRTSAIEPTELNAIPDSPNIHPDAELAAVVHEELSRLSERERLPLILCEMEGMSHADAAKALGWRVGTVSGRLSRARAKLRARLARRGLSPVGSLLPVSIAPAHLISNALSLTTGAASPAVVSLTEGVLAMNTASTWKWVAVAVVCIGVTGTGTAIGLSQSGDTPAPGPVPAPDAVAILPAEGDEKNPAPAKGKPADADWLPKSNDDKATVPSAFPELVLPENDKTREENFKKMCPRLLGETAITIAAADNTLQKLLKARLHQGIVDLQRRQAAANVRGWDVASMQARQEICKDIQETVTELWAGQPKEFVPWLEELVVMAKDYERFVQIRLNAGNALPTDLNAVTRYRLSVEVALWKAKNGK